MAAKKKFFYTVGKDNHKSGGEWLVAEGARNCFKKRKEQSKTVLAAEILGDYKADSAKRRWGTVGWRRR